MTLQENMLNLVSELDDQIVVKAKKGDPDSQDYILSKYKNLVKSVAKSYKIAGADMEDIIQEGMIGLYKAIRDYDISTGVYFHVFARTCISRQIISAVRAASRKKHMPLNEYISLDWTSEKDTSSGDQFIEADFLNSDQYTNPETIFLIKEKSETIQNMLENLLTKKESEILKMYLEGSSYKDMAAHMSISEKGISSTIQRIKRKLLTKGGKIY